MTFIDFKKAFDMVHRGKTIKILRAYGVPDIIVKAIEDTPRNKSCIMITHDGEADKCDTDGGFGATAASSALQVCRVDIYRCNWFLPILIEVLIY